MNTINSKTGATYRMVAPEIDEDGNKVISVTFPTFENVIPSVESNTAVVKVRRQTTIVKLGQLAANTGLKLSADRKNISPGAIVVVSWESDSTARDISVTEDEDRAVTVFSGAVSSKTARRLMWDGANFVEC